MFRPIEGSFGKNTKIVQKGKSIQGAIDKCTDASADNPYVVQLTPGKWIEEILIPDYIVVKGYNKIASIIERPSSENYAVQLAGTNAGLSDVQVNFDRAALSDAYAGITLTAASAPAFIDNVNVYATGAGACAIDCGVSTSFFNNIFIETEGMGVRLRYTPMAYFSNSHVVLHGNSVGCDHIAVYGKNTHGRIFWFGGRVGTGYGFDLISGDTDKIVTAFYQSAAGADTRQFLYDIYSICRLDNSANSDNVNCIRAEGGHIRTFGSFFQSESPTDWASPTIRVTGNAIVEEFGTRASNSKVVGDIYGSVHAGIMSLTFANNGDNIDKFEGATFLCDATDGAFAVTLRTNISIGEVLLLKKVDASGNAITFNRSGMETFEGATSVVLSAQWDVIRLLRIDGGYVRV